MQTPTKLGLQVLRRVHEFLAANDVTAAIGPITKHVQTLGAIVERLSAFAVEQDERIRAFRAGARESRVLTVKLRREFMRPVSQFGLALFPNDPVLRQEFSMPKAQDYEGFLAAAVAMAERAEEHKQRFVDGGFEPDFVERLRKAVEALRTSLREKAAAYGQRSAATAGMLAELRRGRRVVRLLDTMVAPRLDESPGRLAEWRTLARFARVSRVGDKAATPVPSTGGVVTPAGPQGGGATSLPPVTPPAPVTAAWPEPAREGVA